MRPAMGTLVHVSATGPDATRAVDAALDSVAQVDRLMSFHDPASELSMLNREAARAPCIVHPWTWAVLRRALRIAEASKLVALEQLALSPQCGFASTEEGNVLADDEQWAKLKEIVEISKDVWGK